MRFNLEDHYEAMAQNVVGLVIAFMVMTMFHVPTMQSVKIQVVLFMTSYTRSYLIRRFFRNKEQGKVKEVSKNATSRNSLGEEN